ncbi:MAG: PAS domain-containing protein, partial [Spirochaetales bacterium]
VVITFVDISELIEKEQKAVQFDLIKSFLNTSAEGIFIRDGSGNSVFYNEKMEAITGYSAAEAGGSDFPALLFPDGGSASVPGSANGENREIVITCRDGSKKSIILNTTEHSFSGTGYRLYSLQAISEKKRDEAAIEKTLDYKYIFDALRVPSLVIDARYTVHVANETFYRNFETTADATIGSNFFDLGNGQWNIPALREHLEKVLPGNTVIKNFNVVHNFPSIGKKEMNLTGRLLKRDGKEGMIFLTIEEVKGK